MMLLSILVVFALTSVAPMVIHQRDRLLISLTQALMVTLIVFFSAYAMMTGDLLSQAIALIDFSGIHLSLALQFDRVAKIMLVYILIIGVLIYRYAQNYLESDVTRMRFLSQFNLVIVSVMLLVMSANLFTAFVAWQFMGINLYILLNHYHNDPAANRAAKKKFVINRIGDCTFLLAIILTYQASSASTFAAIAHSPNAALICGLLFISIMTKCAQFPFHIWLIDTMETPTPVSALMHTGVINAGGVLLTRISASLVTFPLLCGMILFTGLISALLSIHWMNQQPDVKKKLAYSTMGQMGYMLMQCALGVFPAAIFHLMSHGFYKASLFLNAGETLRDRAEPDVQTSSYLNIIASLIVALLIVTITYILSGGLKMPLPPLMLGFIVLTLTALIRKTHASSDISWQSVSLVYGLLATMVLVYFVGIHAFTNLLREYEYHDVISAQAQVGLCLLLLVLQILAWRHSDSVKLNRFSDKTERYWRIVCLKPLRMIGNVINHSQYQTATFIAYGIAMMFTALCFFYGISQYFYDLRATAQFNIFIMTLSMIVCIVALVIANRCLAMRRLLVYLLLFQVAFSNIAFFDGETAIAKIGVFHIMNLSIVLMMLYTLVNAKPGDESNSAKSNVLPTRGFYLVFALLLLIGIPGSASFISEFYLLQALLNTSVSFVVLYLLVIILLSTVVMHSLQLFAFTRHYSALLRHPIRRYEHTLFITIIAINIYCGLNPGAVLQYL